MPTSYHLPFVMHFQLFRRGLSHITLPREFSSQPKGCAGTVGGLACGAMIPGNHAAVVSSRGPESRHRENSVSIVPTWCSVLGRQRNQYWRVSCRHDPFGKESNVDQTILFDIEATASKQLKLLTISLSYGQKMITEGIYFIAGKKNLVRNNDESLYRSYFYR